MRVQPRQQLLEIWEAVMKASWANDQWIPGGRFGANSISDAEQLLCLLLPATEVTGFALDRPDQTDDRMIMALRGMGTATDVPRALIRALADYYQRYTEDGTPIFAGGAYYELRNGESAASEGFTDLPIVDSYAVSITLALATLGFARVFRRAVTREPLLASIDDLEDAAGTRLTAAMVGLLRSFSVNVFPADSAEAKRLCTTVNQGGLSNRLIVAQLRAELRQTIASLRDEVLISFGGVTDLELPDRLFECGWSWSLVRDAPEIATTEKIGTQRPGFADDRPYLYFTVITLNAVEDLFSERTRILGLLNEEQQRLARALQLRADLTRSYWATVATFGDGRRWPLESLPWRTTDGDESDYFTLLVTSLAVKGRASDEEVARVGRVLHTLAERGRITSRPFESDHSLSLHHPGVLLTLGGSDTAPPGTGKRPLLAWSVPEFAALLLRRAAAVAGQLSDPGERHRLLGLADQVWDHVSRRRLTEGPAAGLWDQPSEVFPQLPEQVRHPSWYYTERVVEALVTVAGVLDQPPVRDEEQARSAVRLIREAEQIYDRELLNGGAEAGPKMREALRLVDVTLQRARELLPERPGTAYALAIDVLQQLDKLARARSGRYAEG